MFEQLFRYLHKYAIVFTRYNLCGKIVFLFYFLLYAGAVHRDVQFTQDGGQVF